jgi:multidrug efflux pump subunit AcrB
LIGATGALLASNRPFGFVALLGLIALAGMIMRNTVILVDQIERDIAAGHARYRAIIDATVRDRFTAGDLMMTTVLRILKHTDIVTSDKCLAAYVERCTARLGFKRAFDAQISDFRETA